MEKSNTHSESEIFSIKEKISELKYVISRYDHYYDSVNNKGAVVIALTTFLLTGIITGFIYMKNHMDVTWFSYLLFILALILSLFANYFILCALTPFKNKSKEDDSIIYFCCVANYEKTVLEQKWNEIKVKDLYSDLIKQQYSLAKGLDQKFDYIKVGAWMILLQFITIIFFSIQILINII